MWYVCDLLFVGLRAFFSDIGYLLDCFSRKFEIFKLSFLGNELFKGGNLTHAVSRYTKALTHLSKCFDLSPDDEKEIEGIKVRKEKSTN